MKPLLAFGWLLAMAPAVASAVVDLRIGPTLGGDQVDAVVAPGSGEHFFDLTFIRRTDAYDPLYAYDVQLDTARPGLRLLRVERPDNWVFTAPDATFVQLRADPGLALASAAGGSAAFNHIATGQQAARVFYSVDPGTAPGLYRITLDPATTIWSGSDPNLPGYVGPWVEMTDPGVVRVTPEPSGLALLGVAGLLLGRRARGRAR